MNTGQSLSSMFHIPLGHAPIILTHYHPPPPPPTPIPVAVNWAIIGSYNGLSPLRRQAITWPNAGLLSIGLLRTNLSEIWIGILPIPFKKMHLKISSAKMAPFLSRGGVGRRVGGELSQWKNYLCYIASPSMVWHLMCNVASSMHIIFQKESHARIL